MCIRDSKTHVRRGVWLALLAVVLVNLSADSINSLTRGLQWFLSKVTMATEQTAKRDQYNRQVPSPCEHFALQLTKASFLSLVYVRIGYAVNNSHKQKLTQCLIKTRDLIKHYASVCVSWLR